MFQEPFMERNDVALCVIKVGMSQATGNNCGVVKLDPQSNTNSPTTRKTGHRSNSRGSVFSAD